MAGVKGQPIGVRFWAKVNKTEGCWLWTAFKMPIGYGRFGIGDRSELAHVVSMRLAGIKIPPGMVIDHLCKTRHCVRPEHMRVVTRSFNATENNESPFARNRKKTHCSRGHEFTPENTALKHGSPGPYGSPTKTRTCLTCYPHNWRYCMVPRKAPPGCRGEWLGPMTNTPPPVKARKEKK